MQSPSLEELKTYVLRNCGRRVPQLEDAPTIADTAVSTTERLVTLVETPKCRAIRKATLARSMGAALYEVLKLAVAANVVIHDCDASGVPTVPVRIFEKHHQHMKQHETPHHNNTNIHQTRARALSGGPGSAPSGPGGIFQDMNRSRLRTTSSNLTAASAAANAEPSLSTQQQHHQTSQQSQQQHQPFSSTLTMSGIGGLGNIFSMLGTQRSSSANLYNSNVTMDAAGAGATANGTPFMIASANSDDDGGGEGNFADDNSDCASVAVASLAGFGGSFIENTGGLNVNHVKSIPCSNAGSPVDTTLASGAATAIAAAAAGGSHASGAVAALVASHNSTMINGHQQQQHSHHHHQQQQHGKLVPGYNAAWSGGGSGPVSGLSMVSANAPFSGTMPYPPTFSLGAAQGHFVPSPNSVADLGSSNRRSSSTTQGGRSSTQLLGASATNMLSTSPFAAPSAAGTGGGARHARSVSGVTRVQEFERCWFQAPVSSSALLGDRLVEVIDAGAADEELMETVNAEINALDSFACVAGRISVDAVRDCFLRADKALTSVERKLAQRNSRKNL